MSTSHGSLRGARRSTSTSSDHELGLPLHNVREATTRDMPIVSVSSPESDKVMEPLTNLSEEDEKIPHHHQVLYELLGQAGAESILNPKMEEPVSGRRSSLLQNGKVKHLRTVFPDIDTGLGADALWKILKAKSDTRLKRLDDRIPSEWKAAYGSFLREQISKNKPLPLRSFTGEADVPNMNLLLQNNFEGKVRRIRNHSNIMHRTAVNNHNRATLLLTNNPLPNQDEPTLERFFSDSHLGRRWLPIEMGASGSKLERSVSQDTFQRQRKKLFGNINYLTEKKATVPGTFYAKYDHQDAMKMVTDIPGYKVDLPPHMTARVSVSAPVHKPPMRDEWKTIEKKHLADRERRREPKWQPLTAASLIDYSPTKRIAGSGDFTHGRSSSWIASRSVST